ncbi:hypothetical protein ACQ5ES_02495 [Pseudidiomarina sp. E22-M8]|uniref:hypothetical protein n=1 Tax=Pseudidiomarina sp. E22-M8 TaxID=3424768 RepID=UPI00403C9F09
MTQELNHTLCKVSALAVCALVLLSCKPTTERALPTTRYEMFGASISLIMPSQPVPIEHPLELKLELPAHVVPGLSFVEGESMYMGRIPLQWNENDTGRWQATLYLGACTEAKMIWRLTVPLLEPATEVARPISITFTSVAN